jgi:hypothetical protein
MLLAVAGAVALANTGSAMRRTKTVDFESLRGAKNGTAEEEFNFTECSQSIEKMENTAQLAKRKTAECCYSLFTRQRTWDIDIPADTLILMNLGAMLAIIQRYDTATASRYYAVLPLGSNYLTASFLEMNRSNAIDGKGELCFSRLLVSLDIQQAGKILKLSRQQIEKAIESRTEGLIGRKF